MSDDVENEGVEGEEESKKKGGGMGIIGIILTALLAGAASFAGARFGVATAVPMSEPETKEEAAKPGPTVELKPFVVSLKDKEGDPHPIRIVIAVELKPDTSEKDFESFVPRVRSTALAFFRALPYRDVSDGKKQDELREKLKIRLQEGGAETIEQVLFTDFVTQ